MYVLFYMIYIIYMYYSVSIIIIIIIITFLESLSLLFFRKTNGCVSLNPLKHTCFDKINDQNRTEEYSEPCQT